MAFPPQQLSDEPFGPSRLLLGTQGARFVTFVAKLLFFRHGFSSQTEGRTRWDQKVPLIHPIHHLLDWSLVMVGQRDANEARDDRVLLQGCLAVHTSNMVVVNPR
jgi:hypothetical protein